MEDMIKYLKALVFLQLQAQTGGAAYARPEILLQKAGFKMREIGDLLGKSENAVKMTLKRSRNTGKEPADE